MKCPACEAMDELAGNSYSIVVQPRETLISTIKGIQIWASVDNKKPVRITINVEEIDDPDKP